MKISSAGIANTKSNKAKQYKRTNTLKAIQLQAGNDS